MRAEQRLAFDWVPIVVKSPFSGESMFIRTIATFLALLVTSAFAQVQLYGTVNAAGNSTLVRLDPATGALLQTIGPVGYQINGLAFDPTSGKLYGSTSSQSEACSTCLSRIVTINTSTGAGTVVGPTGQEQVATITFTASGAMYGWSDVVTTPEQSDDLVSINKATGAATWVGDSGVSTGGQSFAINAAGVAYLFQSGNTYTINLGTGLPTAAGNHTLPQGSDEFHHGTFHPSTGLMYGIDQSGSSNPRNMLVLNPATNAFVGAPIAIPNNIHTLAFAGQVTTVGVPVDASWALALLMLAIVGFVVFGMRRNSANLA